MAAGSSPTKKWNRGINAGWERQDRETLVRLVNIGAVGRDVSGGKGGRQEGV